MHNITKPKWFSMVGHEQSEVGRVGYFYGWVFLMNVINQKPIYFILNLLMFQFTIKRFCNQKSALLWSTYI